MAFMLLLVAVISGLVQDGTDKESANAIDNGSIIEDLQNSIVKVDKSGKGQFTSISEAIRSIKEIGISEPVMIEVYPGEYEEIVNLRRNKNISITFVDKENTVLVDKSGEYKNSPLMLSGDNVIKDATIIANHDKNATPPSPYSYAMHYDYEGTGTTLFDNVTFKSFQNSAVGIGMHQDQTLIFRNCYIYNDSEYDAGALYLHNAVQSGVTNQKIIFENCVIESERGLAIRIDDANIGSGDGKGNEMEVTFINNTIISGKYSNPEASVVFWQQPKGEGYLAGNIKLGADSHGNNVEKLNAK